MLLDAKEYLLQIHKIETMIKNKQAEIQRYMGMALSITPQMSGERVQATPNQQKMADAIIEYVDIDGEIKQDIAELKQKRREIIKTIEQLDTIEYDVLHKIYVQGCVYKDIATTYHYSRSWVKEMHKQALKSLQSVLDRKNS